MKKLLTLLFLSFLLPSVSHSAGESLQTTYNPFSGRLDYIIILSSTTLPSGSTHYIQNQSDQSTTQDGQFNISSGTIRGKLMFDTDGDTYFELIGNDLFLFVHGSKRQTWTTVQVDDFLLLENGDFILLENGDKIIL